MTISSLSCAVLSCIFSHVYAEDRSTQKFQQLDTLEVSTVKTTAKQQAQQHLKQVSGATNFVDSTQLEQSRLSNNKDVLAYQAGVYAQSPGNEGSKISIRGSGVNRASGAHASGLLILLDDLPLTGPGGTPYELQEPLWLDHVDVYRGANGFEKGALNLGGALNYVSKTGKDADKLQLHYETGRYGYQKYSLSSGQDFGHYDYYVSFTGSDTDGYQHHASGNSKGVSANVGWQITPEIETRFYVRYRETDHKTPGALTKQQIAENPRTANSFNLNYGAFRKQPGSTWIANKTTVHFDHGGILTAGLSYHDYPMDLQESLYRTQINYRDLSAILSYQQPYQLFGLDSTGKISLRTTSHLPNTYGTESLRFNSSSGTYGTRFGNNQYTAGTIARKYHLQGSDNALTLSNELALTPDFWLITELAGIYNTRAYEVTYPATDDRYSNHEFHLAPRLGFRYEIQPDIQFYGNVSRSIEPAHPWALGWSGSAYFSSTDGAASGRPSGYAKLKTQTANSIELGSRGESIIGQWDLSVYKSWVRNEFLQDILPNSGYIVEYNASPTIHQGIELSLNSLLWDGQQQGEINLRQSYTLSDFHYEDDATFGSNQLAGIPKHYYQAELRYSHPTGFYGALNTEYASKRYTDYANSFYADRYQIWGATLGFNAPNQYWQGWLDFRNIGNKHYAAIVTPGYNDKGQDVARSIPGEGFGTYAGITWRFH
ncbi:TonB-dependent receptor [Acinetobacter qingfengensis]|uniref:TonB-dependent receptor n=2 Tax=Acinetobacter qingfengensis TaxID=1262585 RepID=A0A1E7RFY4_9GAMM|nr:TonB-dependent receptor [Acinetobacter qingfengensis]OEY98221.1 TonB-dependent receptor [Acinetobacter qingfengensis]